MLRRGCRCWASGWGEVLEGRRPLRRKSLRGVHDGDVVKEPIVIGVGRHIRALVRVSAKVEDLRQPETGERPEPPAIVRWGYWTLVQ